MTLVENWKKAYKMLSVQAMTIAIALQGAWVMIPRELQDNVPPNVTTGITISLLVFGIMGRLVVQPKVSE